jgi:peptidyl-prolyl cis-trans isomerase D
MLSFFRNFTKSRYGLIAVFIFLGVIALAFAAGDITGVRNTSGGGASNGVIATVGGEKITDSQIRDRIDRFIRSMQREGQNVTMEQFLAQGGLELAVDEMVNSAALVEFAKKSGIVVSKRLIDGQIASTPAFMGLDGKFSQQTFEKLLADNRLSPVLYRDGLTRDQYGQWLVNRATLGNQVPQGVVIPYASLMLERRAGIVGMIPTIAMDPGADPDDKTLNAYYVSHRAKYTVPQRRVLNYAVVDPATIRANITASDAEIADAYQKSAQRYAATEKRVVRQLIILDQAGANRIAGEVKGGKKLEDAARAAGLEPTNFQGVEKAELVRQTSQAVADAAFAAAQGGVIGPIKSNLGWHILIVDKIEKIAAKSLADVRTELSTEIVQRKTVQALADLRQRVEDGVGESKNFGELVADAKLTAQRSPAITIQGLNPDDPNYKPDPMLAAIVRAGFTAIENTGDDPQIVPTTPDGGFAIVGLQQIVAAAPKPLAQIHDQVKTDYLIDKALEKARAAATKVVAALEKGVPMPKALADAGVTKAPPPKPFDFKRSEIVNKENFIRMAFGMAPKKAKLVEAPDRKGYYIVYLDMIEEHSAAQDQVALNGTRGAIEQSVGSEYAREFIRAIRNHLKVTRNEAAIAKLRAELTRTGVR